MSAFVNLIGKRFGRLVVIGRVENDKYNKIRYLCKCDCGEEKTILRNSLVSKRTVSCGCLQKERAKSVNAKHNHTRSPIYSVWQNMIQRCNNYRNKQYKDYDKRKIKVCYRWSNKNTNGFENFLKDMGYPPTNKHQIDRIDNNKGYYKENCRWVLPKINCRNKRNNHTLKYNNKEQCITDWSETTGINKKTIKSRIERGWSPEKTLTTPVRKIKRKIKNIRSRRS